MDNTSTPLDEHEYPVMLGQSLTETDDEDPQDWQQSNSVCASFGYEFQPASVDKSTPGLVSVDGSSGVQVLMGSSTGAPGGVCFKGKLVEHKETECLLLFDGSGFRLERCPFSCMQLRHVRAHTPRRRVKAEPEQASSTDAVLVSKEASMSVALVTGEAKKRPKAAPETVKRRRGRPKGSTKASIAVKKARLKATGGT